MAFTDFIKLLTAPVGNGQENQPDDVETLKHNFAAEGRYTRPVENGYIDRELNDAIHSFQKDNALKCDGRVNPGGETEATLVGKLSGYKTPGQEDQSRKNIKTANAATLPALAYRLAPYLVLPAAAAWDWWQNQSTENRQHTLTTIKAKDGGMSKADKEHCEEQYRKDTQACNRISRSNGSQAGAICHESASAIYAACLSGKPEDQWPPLHK